MEIIFQYETLIQQMVEQGYGVLDGFLTTQETADLNNALSTRYADDAFRRAGISKGNEIVKSIRGDEIFWLDKPTATEAEKRYLAQVEAFMLYLNRTCYLGLQSYEMHYAVYPVGTFYKRHLDRFQTDSGRKLSLICYLNDVWEEADGGQLRLYLKEGVQDILPLAGRIVIFESDKIEHEVLTAHKERRSVTGWLKTTPSFFEPIPTL